MEIVNIKLTDLKPYENNPRNNDDAVWAVANSIENFGFKVPIVVNADYCILAGHTRYKAARMLKLDTVPCVIKEGLTEEQERAFRLADNKVSEYSYWDVERLEQELAELEASGFAMGDFGFENAAASFDDEPEPMKREKNTREDADEEDGAEEFDLAEVDDEKFEYCCPCCGMHFNA